MLLLTVALVAAPAAPSQLQLIPSVKSVLLKWTDNSIDEKGFKIYRDGTLIDIVPANTTRYVDVNLTPATTYTYTIKASDDVDMSMIFAKRFIYFDRNLYDNTQYSRFVDVVKRGKMLGFNGIVLAQEYIFDRLSHNNNSINQVKARFAEVEQLVHDNGMDLVIMHFSAEVPNTIVHDNDANNPFYDANLDLSEANKEETIYNVVADEASVDTNATTIETELEDFSFTFTVKANTEYNLTMRATTTDHPYTNQKVSVIDTVSQGNKKVIFGVEKYFHGIESNDTNRSYTKYFNTLDHFEGSGEIKVFIPHDATMQIDAVTLQESGYVQSVHVSQPDHTPILTNLDATEVYTEGVDYTLEDSKIKLLSDAIKQNTKLKLTWYPRISVSRDIDHLPKADACAQNGLFFNIMKDQYTRINTTFNGKVDNVALFIDEWREAGWDANCSNVYSAEYSGVADQFSGGDYIGITVKKMIEAISTQMSSPDKDFYLMSDMFDPNFNGVAPYMGAKKGAVGAYEYLPANQTVVFNWLPNPYEPGLEDKTPQDFTNSAEHFASLGIRQIIAGYHDDLNNLDANVAFYKDASQSVKDSIAGFMFLIWFQEGKPNPPSYDDMEDVAKRICQDLPGKWPSGVCSQFE